MMNPMLGMRVGMTSLGGYEAIDFTVLRHFLKNLFSKLIDHRVGGDVYSYKLLQLQNKNKEGLTTED